MPRVAFFSNQFASLNGHGVARYAHNLLTAFRELDIPPDVIPVATWSDRSKDDLLALQKATGLQLLSTGRWLSPLLWMSIGFPKLEHLLDFPIDIVHVNDLSYLVSTSKPLVVTVHDIGPLTHPQFFTNDALWFMKKSLERAVKKNSGLICVSHATADALVDYVARRYSVNLSARTYVTHEGVSDVFFHPPQISLSDLEQEFDFLQHPYILAVGKISPRKNLQTVIRALKKLQSEIPHHLITVGGNGWDFKGIKEMINSPGLAERVHFMGYVSDEMLNSLYQKASLFIYPSLYEGFGLPVLEAMAAGCPVITSNVSSMPEVAGDAALLVDPRNVEDVASAIETVCKNHSLAAELKRKGKERASLFSWEKCAEETLLIYDALIS